MTDAPHPPGMSAGARACFFLARILPPEASARATGTAAKTPKTTGAHHG